MIYEYFLDLYMDLPKFDLCVFPKYNIMSVPIIWLLHVPYGHDQLDFRPHAFMIIP